MSTQRFLEDRKRVKGVCTYCRGPVKPPKRYWCSKDCVHEWKLRRDSNYLREHTLRRDKGICAHCGADTLKPEKELKRLRKSVIKLHFGRKKQEAEKLAEVYWGVAEKNGIKLPKGKDPVAYLVRRRPRSMWEANHIVPVYAGGGCCGLDNIETLCLECHKKVTASQATKRAEARKKKAS